MFAAAAAYNVGWGLVVCLFPQFVIGTLGIELFVSVPFLQVLGMIVGVYGYGYYLLARDPLRYCGLVWIGLAGKTLGPLGFLWYASRGELPWSFGWTILANDLVWWPAFWIFALRHATRPLG